MKRRSLRGAALLLVGLAWPLAACGAGLGPGLTPASAEPSGPAAGSETDEEVVVTLDELPQPTPTQTEPTAPPTPTQTLQPPNPTLTVPLPTQLTATLVLPTPIVLAAAVDCVSYNPANLSVTASGDAWVLRDGTHAMKLFDTAADAEDARRVARNWKQLCFIGRGNSGPDRYRHMITYFKEPSGLPLGPAPANIECITYDPDDLDLYSGAAHPADADNDDWALYSGPIPLLFLANEPDAQRARLVARDYTRVCFIGAGNDRPDPYRYQMEWWRP